MDVVPQLSQHSDARLLGTRSPRLVGSDLGRCELSAHAVWWCRVPQLRLPKWSPWSTYCALQCMSVPQLRLPKWPQQNALCAAVHECMDALCCVVLVMPGGPAEAFKVSTLENALCAAVHVCIDVKRGAPAQSSQDRSGASTRCGVMPGVSAQIARVAKECCAHQCISWKGITAASKQGGCEGADAPSFGLHVP
eukprot:scaffold242523_cov24-Tisochrysis_lutea.AAC.1